MAERRKVIISCALTGAIHTPSMSPYLPVTPDQIIAEGRRAANAGAAILHVHARDPESGRPDQSIEAFDRILPALKETGAVINVTTGGSPFMTVQERVRPAAHFAPELASLNMGSMNFGLYTMQARYPHLAQEWENEHLENSYVGIAGKAIEPVVSPLGYDWKIGIALITSFAAREVFVGTMATLYSVEDDGEENATLKEKMHAAVRADGTPVYTL
ncbi:MAG: 3-keto-5-aminohexanoate cleavage protein, partial [Rhizobiales bacterium]|nr:3-keto-5-aminohexanoate cleavage protein [Hyphomicrobiales bacterium]